MKYMITFMIEQLNDKDSAVGYIPLRDGHNEYALANLCWLICLHLVNLFKIDFLSQYKLSSALSKQQSGGLLLHHAILNPMLGDSVSFKSGFMCEN